MKRLYCALAAACLGFGVWQAATRLAPEADERQWILGAGSVPMEVSQLAGSLQPRAGALDLSFYRIAAPKIAPFVNGVVDLTARVPADGQLLVSFGAEAASGARRPVQLQDPGGGAGPNPGGAHAGPAGGGIPGRNPGPGGPGAPPGPGRPAERGVTVIVDRSAGGGIRGRGVTCQAAAAPKTEAFSVRLAAQGGVIDVAVNGAPVTRCTGTWGAGSLVLGSGVRRVAIDSFRLVPENLPAFTDAFGGGLQSPITGGLVAAIAAGAGFALSRYLRRGQAFALAPLICLPILGQFDFRGALDALRMLQVHEALGPLLFVGVPAAAMFALATGAAADTLPAAARGGLSALAPVGIVILSGNAGSDVRNVAAIVLFGSLGVPLAMLAWINTHAHARRVSASYALSALLMLCLEFGLRLSALDPNWQTTAGWKRASVEFSELLEIRRYRSYPDEGFPVKPPPADPSRRRIVALGGSSTGGAFQMDDLDQFWPKRLDEALGNTGWEVVNQAVGGWNSLHIRLYLESQIERLQPQILVLYVGHNDILAPSPIPYRELYARYQAPSGGVARVSSWLNEIRMYVGLKYVLFALRGEGNAVAVPVSDARENIAAILGIAQARHAHVLLMTEGLNPDPVPMQGYGTMLEREAQASGNAYFDAAEALHAAGDPNLFLDDCHLSVEGHKQLADWARQALQSTGWLQ